MSDAGGERRGWLVLAASKAAWGQFALWFVVATGWSWLAVLAHRGRA